MSICPRCGNQIQAWAHGVCYTCLRIEGEYERYGRRRPQKRGKTVKSRLRIRGMRLCSICGKEVRSDRLRSHRWHAHAISRTSSGKPRGRTKAQFIQPQSKKKLSTCPYCKARMPPEYLPKHIEHHVAARQRLQQRSSGRKEKTVSQAKQRSPGRKTRTVSPTKQRSPVDPATKIKLKGTNHFLSDIYSQPTLLSSILRTNYFSDEQISRLRQRHLPTFLSILTSRWRKWWVSILPASGATVLVDCYGLDGHPPRSRRSIAAANNVSSNSIWLLKKKSLEKLRTPRRKQILERIVARAARELVGRRVAVAQSRK